MHDFPVSGKLRKNFVNKFQIVLSNIRKKPRELRSTQINKILKVSILLRGKKIEKSRENTQKCPKTGKSEQSTKA